MAGGPDQQVPGEIVLYEGSATDPRIIRFDGDPNGPPLIRPASTLCLDRITPAVWRSDGGGAWTNLGAGGIAGLIVADEGVNLPGFFTRFDFLGAGVVATDAGAGTTNVTIPGGAGLPFVATNEWYIDTLAIADAPNRIFPTVAAAIADANAVLPATTPILLRLREGQTHAMPLGAVGIDGTRSVLLYSHDANVPVGSLGFGGPTPAAATLSMSGVLPASVTSPILQFTGLKVTSSAPITIPGPWVAHFKSCETPLLNVIADKSLATVAILFTDFDAIKTTSVHPLITTTADDALGTAQSFWVFNRCRIQMGDFDFFAPAAMAPIFISGITPVGDPADPATRWQFIDTLLEVPVVPLVDDIASIWTAAGIAYIEFGGSSSLILGQVGGSVNVFSETGVGENLVTYKDLDVRVGTTLSEGATTMTWGARTDAENFTGPPTTPSPQGNGIRFRRSTTIVGGIPLDMPNGCIADDPGTGREVSWIKQSDPIEALVAGGRPQIWLTSGGGTRMIRTTTVGGPTLPLGLVNPGTGISPVFFPLRLTGTDTIYQVKAIISAAHIAVPTTAQIEISAQISVVAGVPAVLGAILTTVVVDTSAGAFTAVLAAVAGGFDITASQGASGLATVLWNAEVQVQEVSGT